MHIGKRKYSHGDVVGTYTIVEYLSDGLILCRCNMCDSYVQVRISNIARSKMCKNCRTKHITKPKEDLSGKQFGRLTVVKSVLKDDGHTAWECVCECGNVVIVSTSHLKSGHTQSCGCYMIDRTSQANSNDLTGQRFGRLVAIKRIDGHMVPSGQKLSKYLCHCDCGAEIPVLSCNLVSGNTRSCGCIGGSFGESQIQEFLFSKGIKFTKQYSIPDLKSSRGGRLKFDFALWNPDNSINCLIEFNGEQHYYPPTTNNDFGRLQREETDELKRRYCYHNSIVLFEIRYDDDLSLKLNDVLRYYTIKQSVATELNRTPHASKLCATRGVV